MKKYNVAIVGATGAVGEELFRVLEEFDFPVNNLIPLASSKSVGTKIEFKNKYYKVLELSEDILNKKMWKLLFLVLEALYRLTLQSLQQRLEQLS